MLAWSEQQQTKVKTMERWYAAYYYLCGMEDYAYAREDYEQARLLGSNMRKFAEWFYESVEAQQFEIAQMRRAVRYWETEVLNGALTVCT